jgi:oxygen-independent coproporphyrinogen III oxidase
MLSCSPVTDQPASLYVHVPFCAHKCEYCAFYSHLPGEGLVQRYVDALVRELEMLPRFQPHTVFFGGGTPSILTLRQWDQIGSAMHRLGLAATEEWTVECNPATVSMEKAKLFKEIGVNRISMGVQSFDERLLERLGRIHSREQVFKSYEILRKAGFENVNIDLMFAIPTQTMEIWRHTLREALALQTEHLSCYEVIYEDDTPLFAQLQAGEFDIDEELACAMHQELVDTAQGNDFQQYEIANFARGKSVEIPARACRHNVNYWRGGYYYAAGPSAAGYEPRPDNPLGVRTRNWANTQMYCDLVEKGQRPFDSVENLPPLRRAGEIAAFGLRMNAGWPYGTFEQRTGFDLRAQWRPAIDQLVSNGWGLDEAKRFRLSPEGLRFADAAAELFLVDAEK